VYLSDLPGRHQFSIYSEGDVYRKILEDSDPREKIKCPVGMVTAAALYKIDPGTAKNISVMIPLQPETASGSRLPVLSAEEKWKESLDGHCRLEMPDKHFKFLYDAALKTLILHTAD